VDIFLGEVRVHKLIKIEEILLVIPK
jgi:hypothetical protein